MWFDTPTLHDPLLNSNLVAHVHDLALVSSLPVLVLLSNLGMLIMKTGERHNDGPTLVAGLYMETAFLLYPVSEKVPASHHNGVLVEVS